jgi:hypothetical protein
VGVLLNKKRDGTYKCRAVALGNYLDKEGIDVYAPTLSMASHRLMLIKAARDGDFMRCFDINAAFLNAGIDIDVLLNVPPDFLKPGEGRIIKLQKAIYGLPQSPKAWFTTYAAGLKLLGWTQCTNEAAMWRKPSKAVVDRFLKLTVYVDDNIVAGPDENELINETDEIMKKFSGRNLVPTVVGTVQRWDILGAQLDYDRVSRSMSLIMPEYISKMAEKYNIRKTATNPNANEDELLSEENPIEFPFREIMGSLQWVCTIARPDVARNTNLLSRFLGKNVTTARVDAAKKIIKYLLGTKDVGLIYNRQNEARFKKTYGRDGNGKPVPIANHHLFNDASFASHVDEHYSNSGSVLFVHGTPVAWRCGRQKIRAQSTTEAEWIAAADGLSWVQTISCLEFFEKGDQNTPSKLPKDLLICCDNMSAVTIAKTEEVKPRSRYYALRLYRVRDEKDRVIFIRTDLMCADALTKAVSGKQRALLLGYGAKISQ